MSLLRSIWLWIVGYAVLVIALVGGLIYARSEMIRTLGTPQAQAAWDQWREEAKAKSGADKQPIEGPVQRRVPKSAEPPALVLLRDYFGICLGGGLLFSSLLYFMIMFAVRGVLTASTVEETPAKTE